MIHLLRPLKEKLLIPVGDKFQNVSPNTITFISLFPGLFAGLSWYIGGFWGLIAASLFTLANGILDLLDGHLARRFQKLSPLGDFLDCVVDRYTDIAILTGIAFSSYANTILGLSATIAVLLVSFLGSQSQASGGGRVESGILGRGERHILLIIFPWIEIFSLHLGYIKWGILTPIEWLLLILLIFGHLTALFRIKEGYIMLKKLSLPQIKDSNHD